MNKRRIIVSWALLAVFLACWVWAAAVNARRTVTKDLREAKTICRMAPAAKFHDATVRTPLPPLSAGLMRNELSGNLIAWACWMERVD